MTRYPNQCLVRGHKYTVIQNLVQHSFSRIPNESKILDDITTEGSIDAFGRPSTVKWETASIIDNAIIELSEKNGLLIDNQALQKLSLQLEQLLCQNIAVIFTGYRPVSEVQSIINTLDEFNFHSITVMFTYHDDYYSDEFAEVILASPSVFTCGIFDSPFDKNFSNLIHFFQKPLVFTTTKRETEFSSNIPLFLEARHYNPYFNKKIYFGVNGEIKNAPECTDVFGNIIDEPDYQLIKIVSDSQFKRFWEVNKDTCKVCQDCEYRYMCVDNRLPTINTEEEVWYYENPCNYDPYKGEWNSI